MTASDQIDMMNRMTTTALARLPMLPQSWSGLKPTVGAASWKIHGEGCVSEVCEMSENHWDLSS